VGVLKGAPRVFCFNRAFSVIVLHFRVCLSELLLGVGVFCIWRACQSLAVTGRP
jgi:hypothetical protein